MKVYFETLGCPKNFNDTQAAEAFCLKAGFGLADSPRSADVIVVNTCGFINDAKRESIQKIFEMSEYRKTGKKLVVSGCLSQRYAAELASEIPEADLFVGVNDYEKLPELMISLLNGPMENRNMASSACEYSSRLPLLSRNFEEGAYTATLRIAEGCDNRCAYCIIPSIRGGYRSKSMDDVIEEANILADKGIKEVILIAQDVTNYGIDIYGKYMLPELLKELAKVEGIRWIRLMYCYEDRISDQLIQVMAEEPKICNYIDVPIQHSSDCTLKEMKRRSTGSSIRDTLKRLRKAMPDIAIRTTLIVGFPGETEEDFHQLLDFVEEQKFQRLGAFAYSQEEGTEAGDREDQIPDDVKRSRLDQIMRMQLEISHKNNQELIGSVLEILVEDIDEDGSYIGRSRYDAPEIDNSVIFTSEKEHKPGDFVKVYINDAYDYDIVGYETEVDL